ncbi:uncharacterized protein BJ212DRAFT_1377906 [Suillus subaureus]|uniref:Uncharacterized protein n=1 Tax=Suillus subaureus TaxID=48587 RepID=A0A9P7E476_9AGAM|nr:uncharacterized protein BJ212DRAFT_1377906 [Suillus subaureus]KAG1810648.1 hypothetical protein BJ212DRAFT_1377906 [Suillus subaureus]
MTCQRNRLPVDQSSSPVAWHNGGVLPTTLGDFVSLQNISSETLSCVRGDLLPLGTHSYIDRLQGTLAIIIAPPRELAK